MRRGQRLHNVRTVDAASSSSSIGTRISTAAESLREWHGRRSMGGPRRVVILARAAHNTAVGSFLGLRSSGARQRAHVPWRGEHRVRGRG
jgi:hypothetical protein